MRKTCLLIVLLCLIVPCFGQNIRVATAANLQSVIKVLANDFKIKTGNVVEPVIGSSGNLSTQIKNGAPYDIFLSADMGFADDLYKNGFAGKPPVIYALGSLIICSTQPLDLKNWKAALLKPEIKKIAIANPDIAPYGKAAVQALTKYGIYDELKPKLVSGESIAQVNTYITTDAVNAGFTTQSFLKDTSPEHHFYFEVIDPKLYSPIQQGMVILKHADGNKTAEQFYRYLLSAPARAIFKHYGYRFK